MGAAAAMAAEPAALRRSLHGRASWRSRCRPLALAVSLWLCALAGACRRPAFVGVRRQAPAAREVVGRTSRTAERNSQYTGVSWHEAEGQWQAHVEDPASQKPISLGLFGSERDAAEAFDCANLALDGEEARLNFPRNLYSGERIQEQASRLKDYWRPRPSSQYSGVYRTRGSSKWKAEIELHGVKQFIDYFADEVEAARAVDRAIRSTGVERALQLQKINFKQDSDYFDADTWDKEMVPRGAASCFLGVTYHQRTGQYLAKLGRKHVGLFDTELEAARAYDEASRAAGGLTNFPPADR